MNRISNALGVVSGNWRARMLLLIVVLQAVSVSFFIGDVFGDYRTIGLNRHTAYEGCATVALFLGVLFGLLEFRRMFRIAAHAENSLKIAADAFGEMIDDRFDAWRLSPSEREVALLTLKGFDAPEIAALRQTAHGTVRAQLTSIYSKSGLTNRGQLVSSFIDALISIPILDQSRSPCRHAMPKDAMPEEK